MTDPETLKIEIQGDRFKSGQLPTEFLGDLEQLGKAIVEQAKTIYLRNNPNKQRVPKGFEEYIRPTITGLRTGSAVIDLNRPKREARLGDTRELFIPFEEEQVQAIREILELLKGTKSETEPKSIATRLLKRVGAGLKDGESMRLSTGTEEVSYDRERRQAFLLRNFPGESTTEPGKLTGIIHAVDMEKNVFQIRLSITDINVTGDAPAEQQDYIIDRLKAYERTNRVTLSGDRHIRINGEPEIDLQHLEYRGIGPASNSRTNRGDQKPVGRMADWGRRTRVARRTGLGSADPREGTGNTRRRDADDISNGRREYTPRVGNR